MHIQDAFLLPCRSLFLRSSWPTAGHCSLAKRTERRGTEECKQSGISKQCHNYRFLDSGPSRWPAPTFLIQVTNWGPKGGQRVAQGQMAFTQKRQKWISSNLFQVNQLLCWNAKSWNPVSVQHVAQMLLIKVEEMKPEAQHGDVFCLYMSVQHF